MEHIPQTTLPQERQWCLRTRNEKGIKQTWHSSIYRIINSFNSITILSAIQFEERGRFVTKTSLLVFNSSEFECGWIITPFFEKWSSQYYSVNKLLLEQEA